MMEMHIQKLLWDQLLTNERVRNAYGLTMDSDGKVTVKDKNRIEWFTEETKNLLRQFYSDMNRRD